MAENQDDKNLDELLEDIALEPESDNSNDNANELDDLLSELEESTENNNSNDSLTEGFEEVPLSETNDLQTEDSNSENEFVNEADVQDEKEYAIQKKQSKLQKILIGVVVGLVVVIIIGLILYLIGFFDPEEPKPQEKEVMPKKEVVVEKKQKPSINDKDINVDRLNKKLNMLTKYEILESEQKEIDKTIEKEKLYQEAKEQLEREREAKIEKIKAIEAKKYEEQLLAQKREEAIIKEAEQKVEMEMPTTEPEAEEKVEVVKEVAQPIVEEKEEIVEEPIIEEKEEVIAEPVTEEITEEPKTIEITTSDEMVEEEPVTEKMFVKFIVINTNKTDIFKADLDKILTLNDKVQLCRNEENRIEIFVGPFEDDQRDMVLSKFKENLIDENPEALDFTQEEFDKRCNY